MGIAQQGYGRSVRRATWSRSAAHPGNPSDPRPCAVVQRATVPRRELCRRAMRPFWFAVLAAAWGCGGGGGGGDDAVEGPTPEPPPESVSLFDSIPAAGSTIDPATDAVNLVHLGAPGMRFTYSGECEPDGSAVRRSLTDLGSGEGDHVIDHRLRCTLADASAYSVTVDATDDEDRRYRSVLEFSTGHRGDGPRLTVLDHVTTPAGAVGELFDRYVAEALLDDIGSPILRALAALAIGQIADRSWRQLTAGNATHGVISQSVSYDSRNPAGEPGTLTGLVAMPEVGSGTFEPRDRIVLLSHSTGSTPGSLSFRDGWHVFANLLASRGYLVIAPDNWGRGGSAGDAGNGTDQPETYLMANRVANNSLDMVAAVLAGDDYQAFHSGENADMSVVGYSQGGHSAVAVWLANRIGGAGVRIREVYSGGAPHNLYQTVRGTLVQMNGDCEDDPWCRDVDEDTILPYLVGRILPPLLEYTDLGLTGSDLIDGAGLVDDFVTGLLNGDGRYDALKTMLQLNTFTNIVEPADALAADDTRLHFFHSPFDRLVPEQNTRDIADLLAPAFEVAYHDDECAGTDFATLARTVRVVGVVHVVCAMETLDEVLKDFPAREGAVSAGTPAPRPAGEVRRRWLSLAESYARAAASNPEALASFRAGKSPEELRMLADMLLEPGSEDLRRLAKLL